MKQFSTIILILFTLSLFGQRNSTTNSNWHDFALKKEWYNINNALSSEIINIKIDTLNETKDSITYYKFQLDTIKNLITKIYFDANKKNKKSPKRFNSLFCFDSLGFPYEIDTKNNSYSKNSYSFNEQNLMVKENQWTYVYNNENQVIKALSDTLHYRMNRPYSIVEFYYLEGQLSSEIIKDYTYEDNLVKTTTVNYIDRKGPYNLTINITEFIHNIKSSKKTKIDIKKECITAFHYSQSDKLYSIDKLKIINKN